MRSVRLLPSAFLFALLLSGAAHSGQSECRDSLRLGDSTYAIPEFWCARWIDSSRWADPVELAKVPDRYAYKDYRIYLLKEARDAFVRMADAAAADSIDLIIDSGFRSPDFQRKLIKRRLEKGEPFARIVRHVAPPGFSEHHTGRAFDLMPSEAAFAFTPAYAWLKEHAATYGFRESYSKDEPDALWWESWHWYYAGMPAGKNGDQSLLGRGD